MVDQLAGATSVLMVVLGYVLLVQAMTAAVIVLAEFIVWRLRTLRLLLGDVERTPVAASAKAQPQGAEPVYKLGGDIHW